MLTRVFFIETTYDDVDEEINKTSEVYDRNGNNK